MRTTFNLVNEDGKIDFEVRKELLENARNGARYLASRSYFRNETIRPKWLDLIESQILEYSDSSLIDAWKKTEIILTDTPTVQASTEFINGQYKLYLPIMTRSFFKQMNTAIANIRDAFEKIKKGELDSNELTSEFDSISKTFLGYCWFIRDEFDPGLIPYPYFNSVHAIKYASHIAFLQTLTIVAHELGHVVLGHLDGSWTRESIPDEILDFLRSVIDINAISDRELKELEADLHAFSTLLIFKIHDIDDKIFAALSLMDYLQMFAATSSVKIGNLEGGENTVKYNGIAFDRWHSANIFLSRFWSHDGERLTNNLFHNMVVNKYLRKLRTISQTEIEEITDRKYM